MESSGVVLALALLFESSKKLLGTCCQLQKLDFIGYWNLHIFQEGLERVGEQTCLLLFW